MKVTSASVDFPAALAIVREGGALDEAQSARLFEAIMTGAVADAELRVLSGSAGRSAAPRWREIVGAVKAMRAHMRPVAAPPEVPSTCAAPAATAMAR